jgi:membrane fusion protein, multidrug efflux system
MTRNRPGRTTIAARTSLLLLAAALAACGGGGGGEMQMPPTEVNVAPVVAKRVAQWDEFTGRIEAVESVELRPRVGGYLTGVHF